MPPGAFTHKIELIYRGSQHDKDVDDGAFRSQTFYKKCKEAYDKADIVVWLVGHKEFIDMSINENKIELDFCGVRK